MPAPTLRLRPQSATYSSTYSSTTLPFSSADDSSPTPDPRWLSSIRARLGHCITFGLNAPQTKQAGLILSELGRDWRELLAGGEGFLTQKGRRGLWKHEVFWGDQDSMGHVNNVVYNRYAESGRVQWTRNCGKADPAHAREWSELDTPRGNGMILRSIKTDFKFPMVFPDRVTVLHKLREEPSEGMDAFTLDVLILSEKHQRPAARCVEDIVMYDYRAGKKIALPPFMLAQFKEIFAMQEQSKKRHTDRARQITRAVEQIEKDSWDRPDAKEDFGTGVKP